MNRLVIISSLVTTAKVCHRTIAVSGGRDCSYFSYFSFLNFFRFPL